MDKTQDAELTLEAMRLLRDFMASDDERVKFEKQNPRVELRRVGDKETEEAMTHEHAARGRDVDRIYEAFHGAAVRFGESRITCRNMSNGRKIYYPASWDERRTSLEERERRLREIRSSMGH
jgi:hypothetical protein